MQIQKAKDLLDIAFRDEKKREVIALVTMLGPIMLKARQEFELTKEETLAVLDCVKLGLDYSMSKSEEVEKNTSNVVSMPQRMSSLHN